MQEIQEFFLQEILTNSFFSSNTLPIETYNNLVKLFTGDFDLIPIFEKFLIQNQL